MAEGTLEVARAGLAAFNRRDLSAMEAICSPDLDVQLVGVIAEPVHYKGAAGIAEYFRDQSQHWDSFAFEVEDIRAVDDRVAIIGTQTARGRASGMRVESREAIVLTIADGLITAMRGYRDPAEALEAVGLEE